MFPMRQPGLLYSSAKGVRLVEGFSMAHTGTSWTAPRLSHISALYYCPASA